MAPFQSKKKSVESLSMDSVIKDAAIKNPTIMKFRKSAEVREEKNLAPRAAFSKEHRRRAPMDEDHRLPYRRDADRILHSKAYARYTDKTQVVYLVANDHITHRGLHVQLVANFAKGLAELLHLNADLVEAISLGHDVGHAPFGHEGEGYLSAIVKERGGWGFQHPIQSYRLFTEIEPLNLGLYVYDGFICHDGAMASRIVHPKFAKRWSDLEEEIEIKKKTEETTTPATLEAALVKLCDTISYVGKDIEDACVLGIIDRDQVPMTYLGNYNSQFLTHMAEDLVETSAGKEYIGLSERAFEALNELRRFNFSHIYLNRRLKRESEKIQRSYRILFDLLLQDLEEKKEESFVYIHFLESKTREYLSKSTNLEKTTDFIAGMTDSYFINVLKEWLIPQNIDLKT